MYYFQSIVVEFATAPYQVEKGCDFYQAIQHVLESAVQRMKDAIDSERFLSLSWKWDATKNPISEVLMEDLGVPIKVVTVSSWEDYRMFNTIKIQFVLNVTESMSDMFMNKEANELQKLLDDLD